MSPSLRAPISTTTYAAPAGAPSSVSGTPISLLNDRSLACVVPLQDSTAATRSLVEVFPTLPVIPTTRPPLAPTDRRAAAPSAVSAVDVSTTRIAVVAGEISL